MIISKVEDWDLKLGEHPWVGADETWKESDVKFVTFYFLITLDMDYCKLFGSKLRFQQLKSCSILEFLWYWSLIYTHPKERLLKPNIYGGLKRMWMIHSDGLRLCVDTCPVQHIMSDKQNDKSTVMIDLQMKFIIVQAILHGICMIH